MLKHIHSLKSAVERNQEEEKNKLVAFVCFKNFICLFVFTSKVAQLKGKVKELEQELLDLMFLFVLKLMSVCFLFFSSSKVAQLKGRVKELEQELLDLKDGSDEENLLPVGKLQVSTF